MENIYWWKKGRYHVLVVDGKEVGELRTEDRYFNHMRNKWEDWKMFGELTSRDENGYRRFGPGFYFEGTMKDGKDKLIRLWRKSNTPVNYDI
jgi:hypothetical protein